MKRLFDIFFSLIGLIVTAPILLSFILAVWLQDYKSPFYIAPRTGKKMRIFNMVKLRSMVVNADKSGVDSTSADDMRITSVGRLIRKFKIDELSQLWNVLLGDMSFVGPRPNVEREIALYTDEERHLLDLRPGITDFSSIVFSDEGDILDGAEDPDLLYNQIIRPWKSRLGLFYVRHQNMLLDIKLIVLTVIAIVSRQQALDGVVKILEDMGADERLITVSKRNFELQPFPPPGSETVVTSRAI